MKKASRLYDALVVFLGQSQQWADVRHLYVLAWMVVGLISQQRLYTLEFQVRSFDYAC